MIVNPCLIFLLKPYFLIIYIWLLPLYSVRLFFMCSTFCQCLTLYFSALIMDFVTIQKQAYAEIIKKKKALQKRGKKWPCLQKIIRKKWCISLRIWRMYVSVAQKRKQIVQFICRNAVKKWDLKLVWRHFRLKCVISTKQYWLLMAKKFLARDIAVLEAVLLKHHFIICQILMPAHLLSVRERLLCSTAVLATGAIAI